MALARIDRLTFAYPDGAPVLRDVSLDFSVGERVALVGPSGSGKSTLLRALAGLVPHFHGGRLAGRVHVGGLDTRCARPSTLAGTTAAVFQDPEDQVVMTRVGHEVAFGLENLGTAPDEIGGRAAHALRVVHAGHLAERRTAELSGGELQRVCLASALAMRPKLLLLDEPTSQLDEESAEAFLAHIAAWDGTVVMSEHRLERAFALADRVICLDAGRVVFDGPTAAARAAIVDRWPAWNEGSLDPIVPSEEPTIVVHMENVAYAYDDAPPAVLELRLTVRRGEIVALEGPNGSGKTTAAKLAAGLLTPAAGTIARHGRVGYMAQDPGRYVLCERVVDEVALSVGGDHVRARAALDAFGLGWAAGRHARDLSSGERQRLALAAVAVSEPDVLVLDEPTRGMDPHRKHELAEWIARYAASGRGVLLATHDRSLPAHRRVRLGGVPAEALRVG